MMIDNPNLEKDLQLASHIMNIHNPNRKFMSRAVYNVSQSSSLSANSGISKHFLKKALEQNGLKIN